MDKALAVSRKGDSRPPAVTLESRGASPLQPWQTKALVRNRRLRTVGHGARQADANR